MEDISKMKAPKKLKLSKPRPRMKDWNQNEVQVKQLMPTDYIPPKIDEYSLLRDENYDIRGDALESQYTSDILNGNTNNISNTLHDFNRNKDIDTCSIGSNSTEGNNSNEITIKMRAPRKVKLTKPRPLRSSKSEDSVTESTTDSHTCITDNGNKEQDITEKISRMIAELKQGNLSVNDCLQLRDLLAVHCPHLEMINKEYIDSCFRDIEYIIQENNLDKLVLVSLRDLTALRQRAWQPYPKPSSTRKKSITWNDIYEEIPYRDCMLYSSDTPIVQTQMSLDSGLGDEHVLWDTEEAFEEDLTSGIWSEYNKSQGGSKERSPSPLSVIEAVQGLKIVGEDEEFVKAAAELLQKYIRDGQVTDVNHSKIDKSSKWDLKNNVIRQPIGPGTSDKLIKEVEKTLPDGMHTAKGRRAMFKTYSSAMSTERDNQNEINGPKTYSREEILHLALSPFSRICPTEMSYLSKVFSDVCVTKVDKYFHKDDLPVRDYSWNCPIRNQRQENVENNSDFKSGHNTLRRGYSCPGDSDHYSNGFKSGFGDKTNSGFGAPLVRRGFSCPSGDSDSSDSGSSSGFGFQPSFKRTTSQYRGEVQYNNESRSEKRGFGSPDDKQGFKSEGFSPVDRTQVTERKGFGSPENNIQRSNSLPGNTEDWDI